MNQYHTARAKTVQTLQGIVYTSENKTAISSENITNLRSEHGVEDRDLDDDFTTVRLQRNGFKCVCGGIL